MSFKEELFFEWYQKDMQKAFNYLYNELNPGLMVFIAQFIDQKELSEDVGQEVWVKVYRKLGTFRRNSSLKTWLYAIARNSCLDQIKKTKRIKLGRSNIIPPHQNYSVNLPDGDKIVESLNWAIGQLPLKQKEVFLLRYFEEISYKDLSEMTGTSVGGLKANYHLACKKIEELLKSIYEGS